MALKRWLKKIIKAPFTQTILAYLGAGWVILIYHTTRWQMVGNVKYDQTLQIQRPIIFCCWHQRLFILPCFWDPKIRTGKALLSSHSDGLLISKILKLFHVESIYGSTTRGGDQAGLKIVRDLRKNNVIFITPDGPKGPHQCASKGIAHLAFLSKALVVPVSYRTTRHIKLKSWDQFMVPLPFSSGTFVCGEPIDACAYQDVEALLETIQNALMDTTTKADSKCEL
ncbi:MAG: lysophospholipid acyltransferase family protein [Alphaproteobacteria bacterium]|nr:lysophospholipid acyltransferase family protein [Alphaproteobacteria bacterium]